METEKQKTHKAMWGINHVGHDLEIATQETDVFFFKLSNMVI